MSNNEFSSLSSFFGHLETGGRARLGDKIIFLNNGEFYFSSRGHDNLFEYKASLQEIIKLIPEMRMAKCNEVILEKKLFVSEIDFLKGKYNLTEVKKEESDIEVDVVFNRRVYE